MLGNPAYSEWARRGYCSAACFRKSNLSTTEQEDGTTPSAKEHMERVPRDSPDKELGAPNDWGQIASGLGIVFVGGIGGVVAIAREWDFMTIVGLFSLMGIGGFNVSAGLTKKEKSPSDLALRRLLKDSALVLCLSCKVSSPRSSWLNGERCPLCGGTAKANPAESDVDDAASFTDVKQAVANLPRKTDLMLGVHCSQGATLASCFVGWFQDDGMPAPRFIVAVRETDDPSTLRRMLLTYIECLGTDRAQQLQIPPAEELSCCRLETSQGEVQGLFSAIEAETNKGQRPCRIALHLD